MSNIILTRYLYIKDEVEKALLVSILNKSDDAIFWAYELFYSGITKKEFFKLIWNIYYDFFAILNPSFESYLLKKQKETIKNNTKLISTIIQNFLIRPFNTDIYFNYNINKIYESEIIDYSIEDCIKNNDLISISNYILNCENKNTYIDIYKTVINILNELGYKLNTNRLVSNYIKLNKLRVSKRKILLTKILSLLSSKLTKGKNFYIVVDPEEIVQYETIKVCNRVRSYRILKKACICGINDSGFIDLFVLERNKLTTNELLNIYNNWLYYASSMPIWNKRIKKYGGKIDHNNKCVSFEDEELEEMFRNKYDYEYDEQNIVTKNKLIDNICQNNSKWLDFYKKYSKNNIIQIDSDILNDLDDNSIKI